MLPGGSIFGTDKKHNSYKLPGSSSVPAKRFLEKFQKCEFLCSLDRVYAPNNHIFYAIKQYEIKGTVPTPLTWIPCLKDNARVPSLISNGFS